MAKSSVRGVHGVTLADIHGEDVELYETNTKASWKHCLDPSPRRIILSNRPVRSDEGLYVKLSGTGSARVGFTNCSPYEDNTLENFEGTVLFDDYLFEKSMRKQIQLNLEEEKFEAIYFAEFETNQKTIQRKRIPKNLTRDNLFLFCEIIFGTIRISFETKGSNPLVCTTVHGDQVAIDENSNAQLKNTTGGIVIPEIEMKINTPVQIVVKPKHKISDGCFFMRYGLTNISLNETTTDTLVKYCIANTDLDNESKETFPFWFENTAVRADAFPGVFMVSITENLDVKTNINSDCIMVNLSPIGPDLRQPVWLVLEVFQADDVMVEVHPSVQHARKQEVVSEVDAVHFSERIIVGWADKEIEDKVIGDFVYLKADERPEIVHGRRKNRVLLTFKAKRKVDYLKQKLTEPAFWNLIDVVGVAETCSVLVCGLPLDEKLANIGIFFKNKNKVGMTLDVKKCELRPNTGEAILLLGTIYEVHSLCEKKLEYKKGSILKISPYYSNLDDPTVIPDGGRNREAPDEFDKVYDEEKKVKYIRKYQKSNIEHELAKVCSSIKWRKDQGKDVRFEFKCQCGKSEICKGIWVERSDQVFSKMVDKVHIENRKFSQSVWVEIKTIVDSVEGEELEVLKYEDIFQIEITGMKGDANLSSVLSRLDSVKEPPPIVSESLDIRDIVKLQALQEFHLISKIENEETVDMTVCINDSGRVVIKGQAPNVRDAKHKVLLEVSKLARQEFEFPNKYYEELLQVPIVKDKTDVELSHFKSPKSIVWRISEERLTVVCLESVSADTVANKILSIIREETFTFKGNVSKHRDSLKTHIIQVKEKYKQYSRLEYSVNQKDVQITITCVDGFLDVLHDEFKAAIEPYLAKDVKILVPQYIAKYMNDHIENEINSNLRSKGIEDVVQYKDGIITANVTLETHKSIMRIFHAVAKQIHLEWVSYTMYGIDMYFSEKEGIDLLHSMEGPCGLQLLSKIEMKENNVHSVAVLASGTAIFALAGDLSHPIERVDVIVNPTDANMKNKRGVSRAIAETGGKTMQDECSEYLNKSNSLKPNKVFVSSAGELRCQNVFHILESTDQVADSIRQILQAANDENNGIYRSIAMPLLGAGIGNQVNRSAKATMEVFRDCLRGNSNIRQVFLYDRNPKIVRMMQSEMHRIFGRNCFKMPMENLHVNKAKTLKPSEFHSLRRTGVRTIPLPGGKKLLLTWGELQNQKADVLVNATASAPKPAGKIHKSLCDAARRPDFQLEQECEKEFKKKMVNGVIPDGTVVDTPAGRLPCSTVFHLKIAYPWDGYNGKTNLQQYIKNCLWYAIKTNTKSIAFPTIGTADCDYPKNEVAQIFMRTVGEFMNKHSSTKLEEISVVIYKDDYESTMQFEETVSNTYSNRPHRLEAHIEEALILNKEGERHEEKEHKPKNQGNFHVARQMHPAPKKPPANQGYSGGESKYKISSTVTLSLVVENIENMAADVLVCTAFAGQFPKLHGAIAFALSKASGGSIQNECQQTYGAGLPQNDIPCTSGGGGLKCQSVFYILLEDYASSADAAKIKDNVKQCLKKADTMNIHSICFPTIGTGNFKYPDFESAQEMLKGFQEFFSSPPQTITKVIIALFSGAPNTVKAFQKETQRVFQTISPPKGAPAQQPSKNTGNRFAVTVPNTLTTVEVFEGQLELTKADVILNTTTSFPYLNGAVPNALCRQGGQSIRDECQQYNGKADNGDIIETKAGNLQCQSLFHYVLPDWDQLRGAKIIQNCMTKCLQLMTNNGFNSIALPAIGTGGYKYEPVKVAEGVYAAVKAHAEYKPGDKCKVMIVLFPPAQIVNKEILGYFQQLTYVDGSHQSAPPKKRVTFDDDGDDRNGDTGMPVVDQPKTDFVLLRLVSRDKKMIETTKKKISDRIKTDSEPLSITLPQHGEDVLKNQKHMKILKELCASYNVEFKVDLKKKEIWFEGVSPRKEKCKEQVRSLLNDMADKKGNLVLASLIQNVEWCYEESGGKILVPYPKSIAYNLETEKSRGAIEVKFKDTDGCEYMVDLNKMEEYKMEDEKRTSMIGVSRKYMATGELARFPDSWDPMVEDTNAAVIPLDTNSPEYADVLKQFKKTLGNYRLNNVVQISRIQNKTLYHQYKIEKEKLDKANKRSDNEKTLWHGTAADKEKYITENGFNRSYAGGTFGGKVWYGQGVYFAVHSKYSAINNYSPPDQNGLKRMFLVKVLTGEYADVYRGYTDKFAPLKPDSNTERFDSVCDDVQNPQEFVIFRDTAAYPEYVISF